jgi:hypothetical protein
VAQPSAEVRFLAVFARSYGHLERLVRVELSRSCPRSVSRSSLSFANPAGGASGTTGRALFDLGASTSSRRSLGGALWAPGTQGGSRRLPGGAEGIRTSDLRSAGTHALDG